MKIRNIGVPDARSVSSFMIKVASDDMFSLLMGGISAKLIM
jgi:hypothetical protein